MYDELPLVILKEVENKRKKLNEGKLSSLAREAEGLSKSDPRGLLSNLGITSYSLDGNTNAFKVYELFNRVRNGKISGESYMSLVFDEINKVGNNIEISLHVIRTKEDKQTHLVSQRTLKSIVGSILYAAASIGLIDWNEDNGFVVSRYDDNSRGKVTITCK